MNRHPIDVVALILGCVMLSVVAIWALVKTVTMHLPSGEWFLAGGLVVAGLIGLVASLRPGKPER
jgi:hypothetical protein